MKKIKILLLLLIFTGFLFLSINFFKVRTVLSNQESCVRPQDVTEKGKIIFLVSQKKLQQELSSKYNCLSQIKVRKIYPSKISLEITVKKPSLHISGTDLYLTEDGLVSKGNDANLPQLYLPGEQKAAENEKISNKNILFAAKIASLSQKTDFHTATVRIINDQEIAVYDTSQTVLLLTTLKDAETQIDSLQQVLAATKIDSAKLEKIDLRFDKPIVTYK